MDVGAVLKESAQVTPDTFSNSDSVIVDGRSVRQYAPDGIGKSQDETFVKVLTEKGRRDNRTQTFGFMLPYTTVSVPLLEVIHPDGSILPVDVPANSQESIDDSQMAENIYDPNSRVLKVNIPELEIGDTIHLVARQTIQRPLIPAEFDDENVFEGVSDIHHMTYEVHAPASLPLRRIALRDPVAGTARGSVTTNEDGSLTYFWSFQNVPRMYDEADMPPYDEVLQRLLVSTCPEWQDISKWYWNLSQSHLQATSPEMKQTVDHLLQGCTNDTSRMESIFYYVSRNVRYMGLTPEKDRPGFEPHDVCVTFQKNYGVCRDKAALLVAMLRMAGFKAYPVLINIGALRDPEVPEPDFDHAIACVEDSPGHYILMDPTDEHTRDFLPSYDCNRSYLVCRPEGDRLRLSPVPSVLGNLMEISTHGTLDASGHLQATTDLAFGGVNDDEYRNAFSHMKPDDEQHFFERSLKTAMPGARLISWKLLPENMQDMSAKLHASLEYAVDGMDVHGRGLSVVSLPWIGSRFGVVNFLLDGADLEKRKYPLETSLTCGLHESMRLDLVGRFGGQLSLPSSSSLDDPGMSYGLRVQYTPGKASQPASLNGTRQLELKTVEFSPSQYLVLKNLLKDMNYDARKCAILESGLDASRPTACLPDQTPISSDAEILKSEKELNVANDHTATYKVTYSKRILTYNGKIREAEIKIPFNPATGTATLLHAAVIARDGQRQEIAPGEINIMDQGWNGSAKRYTGGRILVANLPNVEVGSRIEVSYQITMTNQAYIAGFEPFQFPDALDQKSLRITAPSGVRVHASITGPAGVVLRRPGGGTTGSSGMDLTWAASHLAALPVEKQIPPDWLFTPGVSYCVGDPAAFYHDLKVAMLDHAAHSTQASHMAISLTSGMTNRLDALVAIRDFIVKAVRVAGPSFTDLPLSELSDADTTLSDGYGHLADRAILFEAMLETAGFHPHLVLASGLPAMPALENAMNHLGMPQAFDDPLVCVTVHGRDYYLNDTDQYAEPGSTPADGHLAINLDTGASVVVHALKDCRNRMEKTFVIHLDGDGKARITVSSLFYGTSYNEKHHFFAELPPEERNRYYQAAVSGLAQGCKAVGPLVTRFDQYPGLEEFTADMDHFAVVDGDFYYFDSPSVPALIPVGSDQRTQPLYLDENLPGQVQVHIEIPGQYGSALIEPKDSKYTIPGGSWVRRVEKNRPGQSLLTETFQLKPSIIAAGDYPAVQAVQAKLGEKSSRLFLFKKDGGS